MHHAAQDVPDNVRQSMGAGISRSTVTVVDRRTYGRDTPAPTRADRRLAGAGAARGAVDERARVAALARRAS